MAVLVLSKHKRPLMPCSEKRARLLMARGRAVVHKRYPFTIRLKDRTSGQTQPLRLGIDPGSRITGMALMREQNTSRHMLALFELAHRGLQIRAALEQRRAFRRRRRTANLRHRVPRFLNRTKPQGWLAPSLQHRVDTVSAWVTRLSRLTPVTTISQELVRFDMQKMVNPEVSGIEYQQGTLQGYEVREYLLEKWGRACAYCGAQDVPLEIEHITAKSQGGSDRLGNLTLACRECNQAKGNSPLAAFFAHDKGLQKRLKAHGLQPATRLDRVQHQRNRPLRDADAVNATRWALYERLQTTPLCQDSCHPPISTKTGGKGHSSWPVIPMNVNKRYSINYSPLTT